jgi:4-hydroxy-tetrahydrodipicolinate synthase
MAGTFGPVVTAMVTPMGDDFALDLDRAQELALHLLEHGTNTLVIAGSTGESPTLTDEEKIDLFRGAVEAAAGKGKVVAGTGTYDTAHSIHLSKEAERAGVDGLLVVTPYYNKPPQRGLVAHFSAVAGSVDIPVVLYNIPGRTGTRIEHETLLELAGVDNIVAVKDSTGDFDGASRLIAESPDGFEVYCGDDWAAFGYACLGAVGVVSVAAHVAGERIAHMLDLIASGDVPGARKIHEDLLPLFRGLFITSNPTPVKAALGLVGHPVGPPRLPLVPATEEETVQVRKALEDAGVL